MAQTHIGENIVNTNVTFPQSGSTRPASPLAGNDLKDVQLKQFAGKSVVLNIFQRGYARVAMSVREFNKRAASLSDTVVLCISKDLPFAMRRFCGPRASIRSLPSPISE